MQHEDAVIVNPRKILVPVDFSPSSHQALEAATSLAQKYGAELYLIHVVPEFATAVLPEHVQQETLIEAERSAAKERFTVSKAALDQKGVKCTVQVEVGSDVAGTILDAIDREEVDFVVFTTHGLSGWYPQVFGSIAEKLIRLVQCPTLLLRTAKPESSAKVSYTGMMEWW